MVEFDRIGEIRAQGSAAAREALARLPESVFDFVAGTTVT